MSTIIRRQRATWTSVDNRIINDERLGLKAMGLLVYMLSKPNDWVFNQEQLGATWGEGREAMRSMMRKLQDCGYVRREYVHDAQGRIRTITVVSELPESPTDGLPDSRLSRQSGEPPAVDPTVGQPAPLVKTDVYKRLNNKPPTPPQGAAVGFEQFWNAYPKAKRTNKPKALEAFNTLSPDADLLATMVAAIERQERGEQWLREGGRFIPNPAKWLRERRWEDGTVLPTGDADQAEAPAAAAPATSTPPRPAVPASEEAKQAARAAKAAVKANLAAKALSAGSAGGVA